MVRVLIVEDQMIMQKYFEYLILQEPEFRLVKTVADAREAVKICSYSAIDLVLMDVQTFHNHDGLTAGKAIKEEHPATKVVIITSLIDPKILERAKTGCADSLWYKDHGEAELRDVIHRTLDGEHVFPDTTPDVEMNWITSGEISPRQLEMLRLYICGMSYSEIAKKMDCSTSGVRWNFQEMITKAGKDCEYFHYYDVNGHFYLRCSHHDGTNLFEIRKVTEKGMDYYERWESAPYTDKRSERDIHKALIDRYTVLPNYAHEVWGCKRREFVENTEGQA